MTAKSQLQKLFRLQELALQVREALGVVEQAPLKIEEIEAHFRERNAEYVAIRDRFDELEADQRSRSGELTGLEEQRKKFMEDLMQVKNQREYAAMLKEIDSVKAHIAEHEDAILKDMEEIENVKSELQEHEDHIKVERETVRTQCAQVEAEADSARELVARVEAERAQIEGELPAALRNTVRAIEGSRQGIFLSRAENGTCQSCFVRIRPQVFQEIKLASKIHRCSSCNRFLCHEPSLRAQAEPASQDGLEAVNGGAV